MVKLNSEMKAGTDAATVTDVQVNHVSQTIAKPNVSCIPNRLSELLGKRKALTANIFEEEELIELSKKLSKEDLSGIDPELLTYSNSKRLDDIFSKFDELSKKLDDGKGCS